MESQGVNNEKGPALCDFLVEAELQHYHDSIRNILKIQKTSQLKYATDEDLTQLGMSRPEQRRLKKFYSKHFPHNYFSKIKKFLGPGRREDTGVPFYGFMEDKSVDMQVIDSITKVPNKHIIPAENIVINKELGMGEFGVVQQGVWTNDGYRIQVAIKCLCRDRLQTNSMEFLKEAAIMHGIEHPSIVRLYGVVLHPDSLMLVTELAPLRSLLECLKEVSLRSSFPVVTLCDFAVQICNGMSYLEEKRLIHRDLAARNILVFTKNKVKISDFGLSRALGVGKDYYQTNFNVNLKLPIAWCAPECISYLRFTTASDVWAYAVTLWEMFSYGFQPWAAFSGHQILVAIDEPNFQRLEQPDCCPKDYYILMQKCWQHDPQKRPKFSEIATMLPDCKPVLVQVVALSKDADLKKPDQLNCRVGDTVTVLDKCNSELLWKGALPNGQTGYFNPSNTIAYLTALLPALVQGNVIRALPEGSFRRRSERNSFLNKRRLRSDMISAPQGDVKHTSHIGLDGACFGDVPFMDTSSAYNHVPRQVVNPYKPSEDLENQPLINPNSPSHCTGNTFNSLPSAYPIYGHQLIPNDIQPNSLPVDVEDESVYLGNDENNTTDKARTLSLKNLKINIDNSFNQIRGSKVKWPGKKGVKGASKYRQDQNTFYNNGNGGDIADSEFPHEYQEISESEKDNADIFNNQEQHSERMPPESPKTEKSLDFGQSLLDEMESMFRSLSGGSTRGMPPSPATLSLDHDGTNTCNELSEIPTRLNNTSLSRKKHSSVKPISAHDQRTLDCAIALANELTARSMNDLDHSDRIKTPNSPNERSKFHFKFPLVGGNHSNSNCHGDGQDSNGAKFERRNFSQEAQSVPDLQSSITAESRMAYECLVEQPAPPITNASHSGSASLLRNIPSAAQLLANVQRNYNPGKLKLPDISDVRTPMDVGERSGDDNCVSVDVHDGNPLRMLRSMDFNKTKHRNHSCHTEERLPNYVEPIGTVKHVSEINDRNEICVELFADKKIIVGNPLPLPPRDRSKPQQAVKSRHTRKYPLIIPDSNLQRTINRVNAISSREEVKDLQLTINSRLTPNLDNPAYINKNNLNSKLLGTNMIKSEEVTYENIDNAMHKSHGSRNFKDQVEKDIASIDSCDGPTTECVDEANCPISQDGIFTVNGLTHKKDKKTLNCSAREKEINGNPSYIVMRPESESEPNNPLENEKFLEDDENRLLAKGSPDKVSIEDLLEFAGQKPCGRQRGAESDEVRIMCKVLNHQVSQEFCLKVLEAAEWNVYDAIKLTKLVLVSGASLRRCQEALVLSKGEMTQAMNDLQDEKMWRRND